MAQNVNLNSTVYQIITILNYIAHLHLASHTQTSLVGSFLGDFVKGSDLSLFMGSERLGIMLHRKIDSFTDQHSELQCVKALFPSHVRRYSGIALDIYFDYLLMRNWSQFSTAACTDLFALFYRDLKQIDYRSNVRFTRVQEALIQEQWLAQYNEASVCLKAFKSIENRFRHKAVFAEETYAFLQENKDLVFECFQLFYPELMTESEHLKDKLLLTME